MSRLLCMIFFVGEAVGPTMVVLDHAFNSSLALKRFVSCVTEL